MEVYLDNAATTRMSDKAQAAMIEIVRDGWGNASSVHGRGLRARGEIEKARNVIGALAGVDPDRIVFTSGATEANNMMIRHYARVGEKDGKKHIVVSAIEHPSVLSCCLHLKEDCGFDLTIVNPSECGIVCANDVENSIRDDTCFVAVMVVNNEIGTIQPIEEIYRACQQKGVPYHCDMTQGVSLTHKIYGMNSASFSFSAHKFHGPQGCGFLILPGNASDFMPLVYGGLQENGKRSGTEYVSGIVSMAVAFEECMMARHWLHRMHDLRNKLYYTLCKELGDVVLNGCYSKSVPTILNLSFENVQGDVLVSMLSSLYGIYCSVGSACHKGDSKPSRVLKSMGLSDQHALSSIRFSFSRYTTKEEIAYVIDSINRCLKKIKGNGM